MIDAIGQLLGSGKRPDFKLFAQEFGSLAVKNTLLLGSLATCRQPIGSPTVSACSGSTCFSAVRLDSSVTERSSVEVTGDFIDGKQATVSLPGILSSSFGTNTTASVAVTLAEANPFGQNGGLDVVAVLKSPILSISVVDDSSSAQISVGGLSGDNLFRFNIPTTATFGVGQTPQCIFWNVSYSSFSPKFYLFLFPLSKKNKTKQHN